MRYAWKVINNGRKSCQVSPKSKFCLEYEQFETVKSIEGSLGIFCFSKKHHAENFSNSCNDDCIVIKVQPVGKGVRPRYRAVLNHFSANLLPFTEILRDFGPYYKRILYETSLIGNNSLTTVVPEGTICYPAVKVLE